MLDGRIRAVEREQRGLAWLAWHVEALSRSGKKFPKYRDFVGAETRRKRQKTPDELWAVAQQWDRAINLANAQRAARDKQRAARQATAVPKTPRT